MPFKHPTTTPTPDDIFDEWLTELSGTELKVLLYIVRRTLGFRKKVDAISYNQFINGIITQDGRVIDRGCVANRSSLSVALKSLEAKQLIRSWKTKTDLGDDDVTVYALWFEDDEAQVQDDPRAQGVVPKSYHGSPKIVPPLVPNTDYGSTKSVPTRNSRTTNRSTSGDLSKSPDPLQIVRETTTDFLDGVMRDLSSEFHDAEHIASNLTQARKLMLQSGMEEARFVALCQQVRKTVQSRGNIEKTAGEGSPRGTRNRMPYFFAALLDRLDQ